MDEGVAGQEKFIEILLIVMSLTLAGSKIDENPLFYFSIFAFLTFAILTRALMSLGFAKTQNIYSVFYLFSSFVTATSFPSVFVPFFFSRLSANLDNTQKSVMFGACALIVIALATLIFMVLANIPRLLTYGSNLFIVKEKMKSNISLNVLFFILTFMLIFFISLLIWYTFMGDDIQPLKDAIQHSVDGRWIMDGLFTLMAAFLGGLFTLFAVKYEEKRRIKHQRKCIATAFYYEIKELEKIITPLLDGFISWGYGEDKRPVGSDNMLKDITEKKKVDLKYKSLYSESGVYYQFLKELYVLDDEEVVKNILDFYSNLIAADRCYQIYNSRYGVVPDKNIDWNTTLTIQDDLVQYLFKLKKIISSLDSSDLKNYVTIKNSTPITESTCTTTHTSEKDAEQ